MHAVRFAALAMGVATAAFIAGCTLQEAPRADSSTAVVSQKANRTWNPETWQAPVVDSTPDDPYEVSVYRGLAIFTRTRDSLPNQVGSGLSCSSCHLEEGRRINAARTVGVMARYPRYIDRTGAVVSIEDRVNYCMTRSLAGTKLPPDSREMQDIVSYLAYTSQGVPLGEHVKGEGMPKMPPMSSDSARGVPLFIQNCARCHGNHGAGMGSIPALWGPKSFSIGASLARRERAAAFIRYNMPFDHPGTLTNQQAYDIAAYMTSMPRPDLPEKEKDWPNGGAPDDVPYDTRDHKAAHPPKLLARSTPAGASIVGAPVSVLRTK